MKDPRCHLLFDSLSLLLVGGGALLRVYLNLTFPNTSMQQRLDKALYFDSLAIFQEDIVSGRTS